MPLTIQSRVITLVLESETKVTNIVQRKNTPHLGPLLKRFRFEDSAILGINIMMIC